MTQVPEEGRAPDARRDATVARLEELARELAGGDDSPRGLLREHLQAARFYLLGAMPSEYQFSLGLAEELLPEIEEKNLQDRLREFLRSQRSSK